MNTKRVSFYGIFIALALVFSYVEYLVPIIAIPGMKLGLPNLVIIIVLFTMDKKDALIINIVRILLVAILFGSPISMVYSICGAALSLIIMVIMMATNRFNIITISTAGGIFHNVGQILAAMVLLGTKFIGWYLGILWISGLISGALIGILAGIVIKKLPKL